VIFRHFPATPRMFTKMSYSHKIASFRFAKDRTPDAERPHVGVTEASFCIVFEGMDFPKFIDRRQVRPKSLIRSQTRLTRYFLPHR